MDSHPEELSPSTRESALRSMPWGWYLGYATVAALFASLCLTAVAERSLHIDEVATFREGAARVLDRTVQSQHGWFLDAYNWYFSHSSTLTSIRLPSILASAVGLWILAVCCERMLSARAGFASMWALLALPQFWMSAVEARFYGFLFLFGVLSFAGLMLTLSRWYVSGALLLSVPAVVGMKFHIGAAPFHAMLCGLGFAAFIGHVVSDWRSHHERNGSIPRELLVRILIASAMILAAIVLLTLAFKWGLDSLDALKGRSANRPQDMLEDGWTVSSAFAHILSWSGRGFSRAVELASRIVLVCLPIAGAIGLAVGRRWILLLVCCSTLAVHYFAAFYSSMYIQFAIKYLSSSLCIFAVLCAAIVWWVEKVRPAVTLPLATAAIPFLLAGLFDVQLFFRRDPSNAVRISRTIERLTPEGGKPVLLAPLALVELLRFHSSLGFCPEVDSIAREEVDGVAETTLLMWNQKFFRAEIDYANIESIAGIPVGSGIRKDGPFLSSFDRDYHYNLYSSDADLVLAGAMSGEVVGAARVLFVEKGDWIIDSSSKDIRVDGVLVSTPHLLNVGGPRLCRIAPEVPGVKLSILPSYLNGPQTRSAVFANEGDLYAFNRPVEIVGRRFYMLGNNLSLNYQIQLPDNQAWITFWVRNDEPSGGRFAVEFDDKLVAVVVLPDYDPEHPDIESQFEVPAKFRGKHVDVRVTNLAENSANVEDTQDSRFLYLERISVSGQPLENAVHSNEMVSMNLVRPWREDLPGGSIDFSIPENQRLIGALGGPGHTNQARDLLTSADGVHLPVHVSAGQAGYLLPVISVEQGSHLLLSLEGRTRRMRDSSVAALISFYSITGEHLDGSEISRRTFERRSSRWTRRSALFKVPEGAVRALVVLFINEGKSLALEEQPELVLRQFRVLAPDLASNKE